MALNVTTYADMVQGSDEWHAVRLGMLNAGSMKLLVTPTLKTARNDKTRAHIYELAAQRITRYVEPAYVSDDMLRGKDDEVYARALYAEKYAPVQHVGYIVRDFGGFQIGYSPDGLVNDDGLIEIKSRRARFQVETIREGEPPAEYLMQMQTGLLVTGRDWCDFISYSGGLPMAVFRVFPDAEVQEAILEAAHEAEDAINEAIREFWDAVNDNGFHATERRVDAEMIL